MRKINTQTHRERFAGEKKIRYILPYLMIAPAIVFLIIFTYWPLINLVQLSFQDYNMINPAKTKFVGLQNFYNILFVKDDFIVALKNTSVYTCCVVIFLILFAILFALWVKKDTWQNYFAQTAFFTPHIIAMISCGMVWAWIMDTDRGILNTVFNFFGLPSLRWLNSSKTAMLSVVIVSVWKNIGYYALIIISSLKSIPTEIYEAAELDNTPRGRKFFRITLPMISPQLFFLLITITIGSFKVFDTIRVMTDGGPGSATDVVAYYIYRYAFHHFRIGLAAAAGVVLMIVMIIMTIIYFKVLAKKVFYQ